MHQILDMLIQEHPQLLAEARAELQRVAGEVTLPEPGNGWRDPATAWWRLVGQIAAVGSSRSWAMIDAAPYELTIPAIRLVSNRPDRVIHRALCRAGVRYCSKNQDSSVKARAIAFAAQSSFVADAHGNVTLLGNLREEAGETASDGIWTAKHAQVARRALIRELRFFGPKSASDFLLGLGLADCFLAFDVRVLNLLVDCLGWNPRIRRQVATLAGYEQVEVDVISALCDETGLSPLAVDRTMFYHYAYLRRLWTVNR